MKCSAKTMSGYRDIFDEVLRFVINDHKQGKKPGKQCWSVDCRQKLTQFGKIRCQGCCGAFYCADCLQYWDDGSKLCPQCKLLQLHAQHNFTINQYFQGFKSSKYTKTNEATKVATNRKFEWRRRTKFKNQ